MGNDISTAKVVVVGGGYAGFPIASKLQKHMDVTLVDQKDTFYHNVGATRALVDKGFIPKLFIPYTRAMKSGKFIQATFRSVDPTAHNIVVTTPDGSTKSLPYDFLVLATGSTSGLPWKPLSNSSSESVSKLQQIWQAVEQANNVTIIGGGPLGVEAAGEIKSAYPAKNVTIVNSHDHLLTSAFGPQLPQAFVSKTKDALISYGVNILVGQRVDRLATVDPSLKQIDANVIVGKTTLTTSKGAKLETDLQIWATGLAPNTAVFQSTVLKDQLDAAGRFAVQLTYQLPKYDDIFVAGDITGLDEPKTAAYAKMSQAPIIIRNIKVLAAAKVAQAPFSSVKAKLQKQSKPGKSLMLLAFGPKRAVGTLNGMNAPAFIANIKSRDLFVGNTAADFGFKNVSEYVRTA